MKDVELPGAMQQVMAMQAEAFREKRARIIKAEAELEASKKLGRKECRDPSRRWLLRGFALFRGYSSFLAEQPPPAPIANRGSTPLERWRNVD